MPEQEITDRWSPAQIVGAALRHRREQIAAQWADLALFRTAFTVSRDEAVEACGSVVDALAEVAASERIDDIAAPGFFAVREQLARMFAAGERGDSRPARVAEELAELRDPASSQVSADLTELPTEQRHQALLALTALLGTLRLVVMETALREGQDVINRQRQQLMEVATPVIKLWDGIVAVPLIGMLDSERSQVVMESLLDAIVAQQARFAILDITGVLTVDSLVAQHLMKTVAAARLMGAECVISGVRPAIAQTIVQLGIDLGTVVTQATLADALALGLRRLGVGLVSNGSGTTVA